MSAYLAKHRKINWIATKLKVEKIVSTENLIFQMKRTVAICGASQTCQKEIEQNWWVWFFFRHIMCDHWLIQRWFRLSLLEQFIDTHKSGNRMDLDAATLYIVQVHTVNESRQWTFDYKCFLHEWTGDCASGYAFISRVRIGFHPNDFDYADH